MGVAGVDDLGHRRGAGDDLPGDKGVAGGQRIPQSKLDGVHGQGRGQLVHLGFMGETGLHGAEAPHGPTRRVVGANHRALQIGVGDAVRPGCEAGGVGDDGGRGRCVGATVEQQPGLDLHQGAVGIGVVAIPHAGRVTMHMTHERLGSAVHHLHRPAGVLGEHAQVDVQAEVLAGPESASHPGQGDAHHVLG